MCISCELYELADQKVKDGDNKTALILALAAEKIERQKVVISTMQRVISTANLSDVSSQVERPTIQ